MFIRGLIICSLSWSLTADYVTNTVECCSVDFCKTLFVHGATYFTCLDSCHYILYNERHFGFVILYLIAKCVDAIAPDHVTWRALKLCLWLLPCHVLPFMTPLLLALSLSHSRSGTGHRPDLPRSSTGVLDHFGSGGWATIPTLPGRVLDSVASDVLPFL